VALAITWIGYLARLVRASMLEVLNANYIRTAQAFGIKERMIFYRYALKNAIIPTIAVLGVGLGSLMGGAIFVEVIFARTGLENSKMSDVATEAGVSQGTLYNYVESKEALFRLLLDRGLGTPPPAATALPLRSPSAASLARRMDDAITANFALPRLDIALARRRVTDPAAELASFKLADGFEANLFASEKDGIIKPIQMM